MSPVSARAAAMRPQRLPTPVRVVDVPHGLQCFCDMTGVKPAQRQCGAKLERRDHHRFPRRFAMSLRSLPVRPALRRSRTKHWRAKTRDQFALPLAVPLRCFPPRPVYWQCRARYGHAQARLRQPRDATATENKHSTVGDEKQVNSSRLTDLPSAMLGKAKTMKQSTIVKRVLIEMVPPKGLIANC